MEPSECPAGEAITEERVLENMFMYLLCEMKMSPLAARLESFELFARVFGRGFGEGARPEMKIIM